MTTGKSVAEARARYSKAEWTYATAALARARALNGDLADEDGMALRDEVIRTLATDPELLADFARRCHDAYEAMTSTASAAGEWPVEFWNEASRALALHTEPRRLCERIAQASRQKGGAMLHMPDNIIGQAILLYGYYLEDLFDDALMAVEWQMEAMSE